ncbi:glycosyltransferase [Dongia deserti]|uniref:glycosyltransferase n=1 Tax=Dongia deserti TaxID=2268030 RepID=UPI000E64E194|nr:hypothetical protein [Dongia deserti]
MRVTYLVEAPVTPTDSGYQSPLASLRYRVLLPARELARDDIEVRFVDARQSVRFLPDGGTSESVYVVSKSFDHRTLEAAAQVKAAGHRVIVDFCDNHFARPGIGQHFLSLAGMADEITAATAAMADAVREATGRDSLVIGDPIEGPAGTPKFSPPIDELRLCWFGHNSNLDTLDPVLSGLAKRQMSGQQPLGGRRVTLELVTALSDPLLHNLKKVQQAFAGGLTFVATQWSTEATWAALKRADAVVIPSLERGDKRVKSPNRLLESINAGRVVAGHPLPSYEMFSDYAYLGQDVWSALEEALGDPHAALQRVAAGQASIRRDYSTRAIAAQWRRAIDAAVSGSARPSLRREVLGSR